MRGDWSDSISDGVRGNWSESTSDGVRGIAVRVLVMV